jgi:hypothetical protein
MREKMASLGNAKLWTILNVRLRIFNFILLTIKYNNGYPGMQTNKGKLAKGEKYV